MDDNSLQVILVGLYIKTNRQRHRAGARFDVDLTVEQRSLDVGEVGQYRLHGQRLFLVPKIRS
ncbi:hypothetical protein EAO68_38350 [Streptomyces sp. wa22]|nr:hypothetical protein EAO68_38350 [Streptomyces sp. wa22]